MMSVGDNIKARRKQLGLNAEALARKIGVSPSTIYRYENGDIEKIDSAKLIPIADALLTSPSTLMGWEDGEKEPPRHETTPSEAALLDAFRRLDAEGQDKVVSYAEDLVASGRYIKTAIQDHIA